MFDEIIEKYDKLHDYDDNKKIIMKAFAFDILITNEENKTRLKK